MSDYLQAVQSVFPRHVCKRIEKAVQHHPDPQELALLFHDIAYVTHQASAPKTIDAPANGHAKKRKIDQVTTPAHPHANGTAPSATAIANPTTLLDCPDVSFQMPLRKKLRLQLVQDAHQPDTRQELRVSDPKTTTCEHALPAADIAHAFCLPVPEKQQRQCAFVLLPKPDAVNPAGAPRDHVLFTLNETPPLGMQRQSQAAEPEQGQQQRDGDGDDTYVSVLERQLNAVLSRYGKRVVRPTEAEFASAIPQSHRKGERGWHVKAHRGSKEGYLWFLPTGILFGFKKPLAFFPFSDIVSISYTSVLQRTFNLVIAVREEGPSAGGSAGSAGAAGAEEMKEEVKGEEDEEVKEIEFSMLDQADFAGIDAYVRRHGLHDASMAAARRAKLYGVKKDGGGGGGDEGGEGGGGGGEEEEEEEEGGELRKAERLLQDEEDEEEEDYVASGGESEGEGEGSSDEEEEDGDGDGARDDDDDGEMEMEDAVSRHAS